MQTLYFETCLLIKYCYRNMQLTMEHFTCLPFDFFFFYSQPISCLILFNHFVCTKIQGLCAVEHQNYSSDTVCRKKKNVSSNTACLLQHDPSRIQWQIFANVICPAEKNQNKQEPAHKRPKIPINYSSLPGLLT